jgi:type I restriction enzyme S subunit
VVLGRKGSLGTVFYVDQDYWPHDTTLWVKDFKGNDPKFVYYFFKSLDLAKLDTGAANPALNRNVVHPIVTNWPPRETQADIVRRIELVSNGAERLSSKYQRSLTAIADLKRSILQKAFSGALTSLPSGATKEAAE